MEQDHNINFEMYCKGPEEWIRYIDLWQFSKNALLLNGDKTLHKCSSTLLGKNVSIGVVGGLLGLVSEG